MSSNVNQTKSDKNITILKFKSLKIYELYILTEIFTHHVHQGRP